MLVDHRTPGATILPTQHRGTTMKPIILLLLALAVSFTALADSRMDLRGAGTCHFVTTAMDPDAEVKLNFCEITITSNSDGTVNGQATVEKRQMEDRPARAYLSGWNIGAPCVVIDDEGREYESQNYWNMIVPPKHVDWTSFFLYCQNAVEVE